MPHLISGLLDLTLQQTKGKDYKNIKNSTIFNRIIINFLNKFFYLNIINMNKKL